MSWLNIFLGLITIYICIRYINVWGRQQKVNRRRFSSCASGYSKRRFLTVDDVFERDFNIIRGTALIIVGAVAFFLGLFR
jgi:hypothetical protein